MQTAPTTRFWRLSPTRIALIYAVFAVLWIVFTDGALEAMGLHPEESQNLQTIKGVAFVLGSAVLMFFLTRTATRQADHAARRADETDRRYRGLIESSPDGVFISCDAKIVFSNDAFAKILGESTPDALLGRPIFDWVHPDYVEIVKERLKRLYEDRVAVPLIQQKFRRSDGVWVPVEIAATPFTYEGRPAAQVVVRDVSERDRAEQALRESEARLRNMAANIPGAIFRYILFPDGTDRVEYMSPRCLDIWEMDAPTLERDASPLWAMILKEDFDAIQESVMESARVSHPWSHSWRIRTPSGKLKHLQGFGQPDRRPDGRVVWDSVIFDITENHQAQEAVRVAESRLSLVLQNITDGFFILDREWRYRDMNPAGAEALNLTLADMDGRPLFEVFPEAKGTEWEHAYRRVMDDRVPETVEGYYEPLDKWFEVQINPVADGVAAFFRDVSERKRAEIRQQFMMRELDHRVKNNLAAVLAITQSSLREADSLDQFSESFIGRIRAMAAMHSLLAEQRWEGVGLVSMLHKIVAPYADGRAANRVTMEGPDLRLPSNAAPSICMTIHELATNTAKHGALSSEDGRVDIEWEFDQATKDFRIRWSERGGPPAPETIEPGFGMDLLRGVIPYELSGEIDLRFTSEGLVVTIFVPGASMRTAAVISSLTQEASK